MLQWFRKQDDENGSGRSSGDLHIALIRKLIDFLSTQISTPKRASSILSQISRFKELPPNYQEKELPAIYLKIEQYLVDEDPLQKFSRPQLRKTVKYRYEPLMELQNFSLIFEASETQEMVLSQLLFQNLFMRTRNILGNTDETLFNQITEWIYKLPDVQGITAPFGMQFNFPQKPGDWVPVLARFSQNFFEYLEGVTNEEEATTYYEQAYKDLSEAFRMLETFSVVVQLLPDKLLDAKKIGLLTGEQIRNVFLNKVEHLQRANDELSNKNGALQEAQEELQEAQETALESVKLFHSVLDTIGEGIVTASTDGNIIMVNRLICDMFGFDEDELIGGSIEMLMPEKYRQQHRNGMERYLQTRESRALGQKLLLEGLKKDRSVFPLEIRITEARIGEHHYFTASMRDISSEVRKQSEQKKAADDLRLSQQRYKNLMELMDDFIFTLSLDGNFTSLNMAFEKNTGLSADEWSTKPFTQLVYPDDATIALKAFQQVLQGQSTPRTQLRLVGNEQKVLYCEFSLAPQMQNGKMVGALGIVRDITSRIVAQKALEDQHFDLESLQEQINLKEKHYQRLVELSSEAVLVHSDGRVVHANSAAADLLGARDSHELIQKPYLSFVEKQSRMEERERVEALADPKYSDQYEATVTILGMDGRTEELKLQAERIDLNGESAVQVLFRSNEGLKAKFEKAESDREATRDSLKKALKSNKALEKEVATLREQTEQEQKATNEALDKEQNLTRELQAVRAEIDALTSSRNQQEKEIERTSGALEAAQQEAARATEALVSAEDRFEALQKQKIEADLQLSELSSQIESLSTDKSLLQSEIKRLQQTVETAQNDSASVHELAENNQQLKVQLDSLNASLKQSRDSRDSLEMEADALKARLFSTNERLRELEEQYSALQLESTPSAESIQKISKLQKELSDAEGRVMEFMKELADSRQQIADLVDLVPICQCKHIRDDQEFWQNLESFAQNPEKSKVLRLYCPDCEKRENVNSNDNSNGSFSSNIKDT